MKRLRLDWMSVLGYSAFTVVLIWEGIENSGSSRTVYILVGVGLPLLLETFILAARVLGVPPLDLLPGEKCERAVHATLLSRLDGSRRIRAYPGRLCLTNERVLFRSRRRRLSLGLTQIEEVEYYRGGGFVASTVTLHHREGTTCLAVAGPSEFSQHVQNAIARRRVV